MTLETTDATSLSNLAIFGTAGIGFVIGWSLYFANRGKSGDISASELAAIVGAIAGAAVLGLANDNPDLLGAYGAGLFVGFMTLLILTWKFVRSATDGSGPGPLEKAISPRPREPEPQGPARSRSTVGSAGSAGAARESSALEGELTQARDALVDLIAQVDDARKDAKNAGNSQLAGELDAELTRLINLLRDVNLSLALQAFTSSELKALKTVIDREIENMEDEANRLKQVTAAQTQLANVLTALTSITKSLKSLLGN